MIDTGKVVGFYTDAFGNEIEVYEQIERYCVFYDGKYTPVCVKTERVDGVRIKEDTYYKLENGEFVEA